MLQQLHKGIKEVCACAQAIPGLHLQENGISRLYALVRVLGLIKETCELLFSLIPLGILSAPFAARLLPCETLESSQLCSCSMPSSRVSPFWPLFLFSPLSGLPVGSACAGHWHLRFTGGAYGHRRRPAWCPRRVQLSLGRRRPSSNTQSGRLPHAQGSQLSIRVTSCVEPQLLPNLR